MPATGRDGAAVVIDGEAVRSHRSRASETARRPRFWLRRLLAASVVLGGVAVLATSAAAVAFWRIYDEAVIPSPDELTIPDPSIVMDAAGEPVTTLEPAAVRRNIQVADLPQHVTTAVLAAEDRRFRDHLGVSPRGIARAVLANITSGQRVQGASTITQQYVALAIEEIDDSYTGKFREAATSVRLERELAKDQILENYLNAVPFGRSAYGIEAGAQTYFGVSAAELDVHQAAVLAGMIAAPTAFDPARNPAGASHRRDFVLEGMLATGALDEADADPYLGAALPELRDTPMVTFGDDAYFLDALQRELPELVGDELDPGIDLVIHTTLDRRAQELASAAAREQLADTDHAVAVVTIDSSTGAVRALVGGRDFGEQAFNTAVQSLRQPGSAFKTFALAQLVAEGYDPDLTRVSGPAEYTLEREGQEDYEVSNYGYASWRELTVRDATVFSVNTAYLQLAEELGFEPISEMAAGLGIVTPLQPFPSTVLGSADVTPLEMAAAYATLSAEGVRRTPHLISRIETQDGELVYEHEDDAEQVIDPNVAAVVTDVLLDVVRRGTGTAAAVADHPVAGKTGTTNDSRDAWFVGYTPRLSTAVWVGNLDNSPMDAVTGGSLPAATFGAYLTALLEDTDPGTFPTPDRSGLVPLEGLRPPPPPRPPPADDDEDENEDDEDDEDDGDEDDGEEPEPDPEPDPPDDPPDPPGDGDDDDAGGGGGDGDDGGDDGDGGGGDGTEPPDDDDGG